MFQRLILVVVICLWPASVVYSADVTLRMKFKPGEVQKMKSTHKQITTTKSDGQDGTKMELVYFMNLESTCDEVSPVGTAKLRQRIPRIRMTFELPGQKFDYDSDQPAPTDSLLMVYDKMWRPMVGQEMSLKSDGRGFVTDFTIPQKVLKELKSNDSAFGEVMAGDSIVEHYFDQFRILLPDKPVKPRETWTREVKFQWPTYGTLLNTYKYKYLGPGEQPGIEKIEVRTSSQSVPDPNPDKKPPAVSKVSWSDGHGEILFDNQLGRVIRCQIKSATEYEATVANNQKFQQLAESDVLIEMVEDK